MRYSLLAVAAAGLLAIGSGCHHLHRDQAPCGPAGCGPTAGQHGGHHGGRLAGAHHHGGQHGGHFAGPHAGHHGGLHQGRLHNGPHAMAARQQMAGPGPAGPPTAAYAYPYYTTRGPRDFLQDNPPSIGP